MEQTFQTQTQYKTIPKFEELPANAKKYITELEKQIGVPIKLISTGPARKDTIQK